MNTSNDLQEHHSQLEIQPTIERKSSMNETENHTLSKVSNLSRSPRLCHRRSFLRSVGVGAMALSPAAALLSGARKPSAQTTPAPLTTAHTPIFRFLPP